MTKNGWMEESQSQNLPSRLSDVEVEEAKRNWFKAIEI
jgi:hypothetical protein